MDHPAFAWSDVDSVEDSRTVVRDHPLRRHG
jgi:hypothetical protein